MFAPLIFCLAAASAAPHFYDDDFPFNHKPHYEGLGYPSFREHIFDTGKFWAELSRELHQLDDMLADFHRRFPMRTSTAGVEGHEYKITIPLSGFEEKDIVVKARVGVLMVQAVHKDERDLQKNYLIVRTLPEFVDVNGTWTYEKEVLNIVFPLKATPTTESPTIKDVEIEMTVAPNESKEELDNKVERDNEGDADVGVGRGDTNKERQISTNDNWRQTVEATTYAVDLKDEVEFVPVHY